MSDARRSIWDWSKDFVGDPASWDLRGRMIYDFLVECGLTSQSRVLNIGCGNLSEGRLLIHHLEPGRFVGVDPAGWLVEAALEKMPELLHKEPRFLWRTDFDASGEGEKFDLIVSHSVLSHIAHWQLDQFLANTRKVVDEGAVCVASFINDQYNSFDAQWVYPGVSTFRLRTITAAGWHAGWRVEMMHEWRYRMTAAAPNDTHHWLKLTACATAAEMNELRLAEEAQQREEREAKALDDEIGREVALIADDARIKEAGLL